MQTYRSADRRFCVYFIVHILRLVLRGRAKPHNAHPYTYVRVLRERRGRIYTGSKLHGYANVGRGGEREKKKTTRGGTRGWIAVCCSMRRQEEDETRDRLPTERRTDRVPDGQGNRNEYQNRGSEGNMCAWRGRRGSTGELDFSDSEFCSSFFLRPPVSLFHSLHTRLSVPVSPSASHHRFTLSRPHRRRAPRFPRRTIHPSAPVLSFQPPLPLPSLLSPSPPSSFSAATHESSLFSRHRTPSPLFPSLDLHLVLWRVARRRPRRPNRW